LSKLNPIPKLPLLTVPSLVLFIGGKNPPNMRWTYRKFGNIGKRVLKIINGFAR